MSRERPRRWSSERSPGALRESDRWILGLRPGRNQVDPRRPYAFFVEPESARDGEVAEVATVFLTNRECPWRCLMCDLWRNTLPESVAPGAIPAQIDYALERLGISWREPDCIESSTGESSAESETQRRRDGRHRVLKLYNSGSFFDARAVPVADHEAIASRAAAFERVIVESHPLLVGDRVWMFREALVSCRRDARLEVAMGLETAHPGILARLNKRMTLDDFERAAARLAEHGVAMRAFVLVKPPFMMDEDEALEWANRSIDRAFDFGADVVALIPTRAGNGALDQLARQGEFAPPRLATLEAAFDYGLALRRGRVFADLWDLERFSNCAACLELRRERLRRMNLEQRPLPAIVCASCP